MKRAVITGGAGFIGSHIVEELVKKNVSVLAMDLMIKEDAENIKHLLAIQNLEYVQGNMEDFALLQKLFVGAEYVFHHAAVPNPPPGQIDYASYYEANSRGILNVLQAAKDSKVRKVIFASSSAVYGNTQNQPSREDMLPQPQSPYAVCKLVSEHYCAIFNKVHGLSTVCLRYFNVYGPRQNPDSPLASVIPKYIRRITHGKPLFIFGDGEQTRDFVFVKDVVTANLLAAEREVTGIYNIGSGEKTSLNKLVEIMILLTGRTDLKAAYKNPRPGDIKHSMADISKAKSIGYAPSYTLANGLGQLMGIKLTQTAPLDSGNPQAYSMYDKLRR